MTDQITDAPADDEPQIADAGDAPAAEDSAEDAATPAEPEPEPRTRTRRGRAAGVEPAGHEDPDDAEVTVPPTRRRTRRKPGEGSADVVEETLPGIGVPAADDEPAEAEGPEEAAAPKKRASRRRPAAVPSEDEARDDVDEPAADETDEVDEVALTPRPRRSRSRAKPPAVDADDDDEVEVVDAVDDDDVDLDDAPDVDRVEEDLGDDDADGDGGEVVTAADGEAPVRTRRRRRGGRGRGRRRGAGDGAEQTADDGVPPADEADGTAAEDADDGVEVVDVDLDDVDEDDVDVDEDEDAPPTRLQARVRRTRTGAGPGPRGRGRGTRPLGGISEDVRRAIADGPPRKMLVSVGNDRTQIAVLEERTLVEHYVTRRQDVSYVGNIYLGRVQNVLPGMEAAFVDIGKGRNGVLYAGEVEYDEADLEGPLPRIEQQLKPGQSVLVQVTKDPMGSKGARLTQHLSIAGRYCVLAPGDGMLGISRKLPDDERERLRKVLKSIKPDDYGLIVRTAAEGATKEQLEGDVARLVRIWEQVQTSAEGAKVLEPVYEEPDLVIRVIRDVFGPEYTDLVVDSEELAQQIRDYLGDVSPDLVAKVSVHHGDGKLFDEYEVTNQIRRALERKVWLKSGGYLIIEKTEAMWIIDVNTGKFVGERNLEETVLRNNIEAATEIARQLRLRDMGGIIVIDFVDMLVPANRDEVLKRFKRELARDKTKSRVMEISKLGLVQMTRKNVSVGLQESFTERCDCCDGRGTKMIETIV